MAHATSIEYIASGDGFYYIGLRVEQILEETSHDVFPKKTVLIGWAMILRNLTTFEASCVNSPISFDSKYCVAAFGVIGKLKVTYSTQTKDLQPNSQQFTSISNLLKPRFPKSPKQ